MVGDASFLFILRAIALHLQVRLTKTIHVFFFFVPVCSNNNRSAWCRPLQPGNDLPTAAAPTMLSIMLPVVRQQQRGC